MLPSCPIGATTRSAAISLNTLSQVLRNTKMGLTVSSCPLPFLTQPHPCLIWVYKEEYKGDGLRRRNTFSRFILKPTFNRYSVSSFLWSTASWWQDATTSQSLNYVSTWTPHPLNSPTAISVHFTKDRIPTILPLKVESRRFFCVVI